MSRRVNSKSITVLVILLTSIFCTSIHAAGGRGVSDRGGIPGMPVPARIAEDFNSLKTESLEQSVKNLYLVDFYYWPRSRYAGDGVIILPLPESEGLVDVDRIFRNMRFIKVYNELSQIDNIKASKLIFDEINETLPLYLRMFSESWDRVFKVHENEPSGQRHTIGPSLQVSDDPNGAPTLAGVRYKLLSLVVLAGNLKLESTRPPIARVVSEALAQRNKFYDPNTGFEGDRFSMLIKAGLYNRQVLATGILLTSGMQTTENNNATSIADYHWETKQLALFNASVSSPYDLIRSDDSQDSISAKILKPLDDEEFDKICQNNNEQVSAKFLVVEQKSNTKVIPVPSQDVLILSPEQTILILLRIGFTDSQIQEHAFAIRDGLAKSGAVRIFIDDAVNAGLAIKGDEVFISTRDRGQFIYNITTGWVNTPRW